MSRIMRSFRWAGLVVGLAMIVAMARAQAQEAPAQAPTPAKGCNPCISRNFDNWTAADEQRVEANGIRYCKAHPEQCQPHPAVSTRIDPKSFAEYVKAQQRQDAEAVAKDPGWLAKHQSHATTCYPDHYNPKNPTGIVCIPDTWVANRGEPQPGQCYTDPKDPTNRRCVPSRELLLKATQDGW